MTGCNLSNFLQYGQYRVVLTSMISMVTIFGTQVLYSGGPPADWIIDSNPQPSNIRTRLLLLFLGTRGDTFGQVASLISGQHLYAINFFCFISNIHDFWSNQAANLDCLCARMPYSSLWLHKGNWDCSMRQVVRPYNMLRVFFSFVPTL